MSTSRPATHTYGSDEATLFEVELRRQGLGRGGAVARGVGLERLVALLELHVALQRGHVHAILELQELCGESSKEQSMSKSRQPNEGVCVMSPPINTCNPFIPAIGLGGEKDRVADRVSLSDRVSMHDV